MSAFKCLLQLCVKLEKIILIGPNDNSNNYDVNLIVIVFAKNVTSTNVGIGLYLNKKYYTSSTMREVGPSSIDSLHRS